MFVVISTIHWDGLPHLLQGSTQHVEPTTLQQPNARDWGALQSPGSKTGAFQAPHGHCAHIPASGCPSMARGLAEGGHLEASQGPGQESEMPAPRPSLPFCLQVSKQYILGVPSAPTQILAGRSGLPFPSLGGSGIGSQVGCECLSPSSGREEGAFRTGDLARAQEHGGVTSSPHSHTTSAPSSPIPSHLPSFMF